MKLIIRCYNNFWYGVNANSKMEFLKQKNKKHTKKKCFGLSVISLRYSGNISKKVCVSAKIIPHMFDVYNLVYKKADRLTWMRIFPAKLFMFLS
jgi:hypothetical protein